MKIRTSISILIGLGITSQAFAGWGTGWNVEMTNLTPRDMQVYPYNCKANSKAKNDTITIKLKNGDTRICSWKEKDTSSCTVPLGGEISGYCAASFWHNGSLTIEFRNPLWSEWGTSAEFRVPTMGATAFWFHSHGNTPNTYRFGNAYVSWWDVIKRNSEAGQNEGIWTFNSYADKTLQNISGFRYSSMEGVYDGAEAYAHMQHTGFPSYSLPFAVAWTENKEGGSKNNFFIAELGAYDLNRVQNKVYNK